MNWLRLHVSNVCNFKCPNCHVFEMTENLLPSQLMSEEIFVKSIQAMLEYLAKKNQKELTISLYGGETLANKSTIKNIIENQGIYFESEIKINWIINTNGSLLNDSDAIFFKKHDIEIHLSIDGGESIHNLSRMFHDGSGTFTKVLKAMELIKQHKIRSQINSYIMPSNINFLRDLVDNANQFGINKIYVDQCYSDQMQYSDNVFLKYLDLYLYSLSKDITLTGPWTRVKKNHDSKILRSDQFIKDTVIDINVDGSIYSSTLSQLKDNPIKFNELESFLKQDFVKLKDIQNSLIKKECNSCILSKECFGIAKEQVRYHINNQANTEASCNFFIDWITYLNQPLFFYTNFEWFNIISLFSENELKDFIDKIIFEVKHLESRLWKLENKFQIHILKNFIELKHASHQQNLPHWAKATTSKNTLYHLGPNPCKGLRHELAHIFLNQKINQCPQWILEGICEWISDPNSIPGFKPKISLNDLESFFTLQYINENPVCSEAYQTARHFFIYLENLIGNEKMCHILKNSPKLDLNKWLLNLTGSSLDETYLNYHKFDL